MSPCPDRVCVCDRESETRAGGDGQSDRGVVGICVSLVSWLCVCKCVLLIVSCLSFSLIAEVTAAMILMVISLQ